MAPLDLAHPKELVLSNPYKHELERASEYLYRLLYLTHRLQSEQELSNPKATGRHQNFMLQDATNMQHIPGLIAELTGRFGIKRMCNCDKNQNA